MKTVATLLFFVLLVAASFASFGQTTGQKINYIHKVTCQKKDGGSAITFEHLESVDSIYTFDSFREKTESTGVAAENISEYYLEVGANYTWYFEVVKTNGDKIFYRLENHELREVASIN